MAHLYTTLYLMTKTTGMTLELSLARYDTVNEKPDVGLVLV